MYGFAYCRWNIPWLVWISNRSVICISDARSTGCFCEYLKDDNWFGSSDPFARSLRYKSRYTSRTVFRGVIVISHRDLIFVKKAGRQWLAAVGRATSHDKFPCPYFQPYLSCKLQSCSSPACVAVSSILLAKRDHNRAHFNDAVKPGCCERTTYTRQADLFTGLPK